jgi:2-amino-4-hydroxy-6-hydroxymethyldihydropteridine diphosphokinase
MSRALLLLGGNMGDRNNLLADACILIETKIGRIIKSSSVYETDPWGFSSDLPFLNQVVIVDSVLSPKEILGEIHKIEAQLGRVRFSTGYEARTMDIDILFYDDLRVNESDLVIPHPRLHERRFTLLPLAEIAGDYIHPVLNERLDVLAEECSDTSKVVLIEKLKPDNVR